MPSVLHILGRRGGGAEHYVDLLERGLSGFEHHRVEFKPAPTHGAQATLSVLPAVTRRWLGLRRLVTRYDLVHAHGDLSSIVTVPLWRGRPVVTTTHGLNLLRRARGPRLTFARRGYRAVAGGARAVICTSEAEHHELSTVLGAANRRLVVVRNGIELPPSIEPTVRNAARDALEIAGEEFVALFVGDLTENKDPRTAVRAAAAVRAQEAPLTLLLAGEGPLLAELARDANEHVRVLGRYPDVAHLLAAADVFVMPSRREGLSYALLEAMGRGLPVVVSDGLGNPEAVGPAGVVFPVGDEGALAAALHRLSRDPEERRNRGQALRNRVDRELSLERFVRETRTVYEGALT